MRISIAVLITLIFVHFPREANAVCLLNDYSVSAEFARSNAVAIGFVTAANIVPDQDDPESFSGILYIAQISRIFRGILGDTVQIVSENSSGHFPMEIGEVYLLFMNGNDGNWNVDNCGNSGHLKDKTAVVTELELLGRAK